MKHMEEMIKAILVLLFAQSVFLFWIAINTTTPTHAFGDSVQDVRIVGHSGLRYDPLPVTVRNQVGGTK